MIAEQKCRILNTLTNLLPLTVCLTDLCPPLFNGLVPPIFGPLSSPLLTDFVPPMCNELIHSGHLCFMFNGLVPSPLFNGLVPSYNMFNELVPTSV